MLLSSCVRLQPSGADAPRDINLEVTEVHSSPYATHVRYTVTKKPVS